MGNDSPGKVCQTCWLCARSGDAASPISHRPTLTAGHQAQTAKEKQPTVPTMEVMATRLKRKLVAIFERPQKKPRYRPTASQLEVDETVSLPPSILSEANGLSGTPGDAEEVPTGDRPASGALVKRLVEVLESDAELQQARSTAIGHSNAFGGFLKVRAEEEPKLERFRLKGKPDIAAEGKLRSVNFETVLWSRFEQVEDAERNIQLAARRRQRALDRLYEVGQVELDNAPPALEGDAGFL